MPPWWRWRRAHETQALLGDLPADVHLNRPRYPGPRLAMGETRPPRPHRRPTRDSAAPCAHLVLGERHHAGVRPDADLGLVALGPGRAQPRFRAVAGRGVLRPGRRLRGLDPGALLLAVRGTGPAAVCLHLDAAARRLNPRIPCFRAAPPHRDWRPPTSACRSGRAA